MGVIPTKNEVREARTQAGLTQQQAAEMTRVTLAAFQRWEYGTRQMSAAHWELFRLKLQRAAASPTRRQADDWALNNSKQCRPPS